MKKVFLLSSSVFLFLVVALSGVVSAQQFKSQDNISLSKDQKVDSAIYYSGSNIDISGDVNGDVYCVGSTVNISGNINGDIFCAGQNINISGKVSGSARLAGQNVNISGQLSESASVFAQSLIISDKALIGKDINGGAATVSVNQGAKVSRDFTIGASDININGTIGRNVKTATESLTLGSNAVVGGSIDYTSENSINQSEGAKVSGSVNQNKPKQQDTKSFMLFPLASIAFSIYLFIAMLITSLVMILLFPKWFEKVNSHTVKSVGKTSLFGTINIFVVPFVLLFLLITILGAPLAVLLGLMWIITLILSGPLFAYFIGRKLMKGKQNSVSVMMIGSVILLLLYAVPVINFFATIAAGIFGSGMLLNYAFSKIEKPNYSSLK